MNGDELRRRRERLHLTQQGLADVLGIPENTVSRWERGELVIEKGTMLDLALRTIERDAALEYTTWRVITTDAPNIFDRLPAGLEIYSSHTRGHRVTSIITGDGDLLRRSLDLDLVYEIAPAPPGLYESDYPRPSVRVHRDGSVSTQQDQKE